MSSDNDWKHQFIGWFGAVIFILAFCNAAKAAQVVKVLSVFHHRLSPWVTTGTAWGLVNTPRPGIVPHPHPESQAGGEAATGAISSPDFVVEGDLISFLANGWDGRYGGKGLNGYYLIRASDGAVLRRAVPPDEDGFVRITWPVSDLHGQKVYFEAIDRDNNKNGTGDGFAWLGFDKLVMERCEVPANRSHWYSVPLPPGENTWQILQHDGAGRHVAPYLSSLGFGEPGTGAITSPPFVVKGPVIRFTLCGWSGRYGERHASKAELIDARTKAVLQVAAPPLSDALKRYEWNVKDLKGRLVQIRLVDRDPNYSFAWMGLGMVDAKPSYSLNFADESPTKTNGLGLAGWRPQMMQSKQYCQSAGVPFLITGSGVLVNRGGAMKIPLNLKAKRLYLAGFTGTYDQGEPVWGDPSDLYHQLFIGDHLGDIVLDYADGSSVRYPLIYGYSAWWYQPMEVAPEPFASSKSARRILEDALAIRATGSGPPGAYMGIIVPRPSLIRDFRIEDNPDKAGVPLIAALTIETNGTPPSKTVRLPHDRPTARQASWLATHRLQPGAGRIRAVKEGLSKERELLYTTKRSLSYHLPTSIPAGYRGPRVRFRGNVYADILTSIFYNDVQDILDKVDPNGMYHTSTKGAPSWGYYTGIGTWAKHVGSYYGQSWSRDLGRSLQEITELGFLSKASACANYCFQEAWRWQDDPTLKYDGVQLPAHWCRVINMPSPKLGDGVFENDGQGLIMLFTYKLWQREPHPNRWLHKHWPDVKAAGDWIGWQLDHPAISGASDVLRTDSECAGGIGNAKYADFLCEEALRAYATMADSIGHDNTGTRWERTADHLLSGIEKSYFTTDKWGPNWTLLPAGWPNKSTNLGPLIILADRRGFAPNDNLPGWRIRDLNAFRRLVSSYRPFGFYGVAMGYGQGFVTQAALLLDQMRDATTMLNWLAKAIYYPGYKPYITPEGCEVDPRGRFWHRTGDLGNGVQEGETVKVLRLVIGVDDDNPNRDQLIPRLPTGWDEISVSSYPMLTDIGPGRRAVRRIEYRLQRKGRTMSLHFQADSPIQRLDVRLGPFSEPITRLMVNGHPVAVNSVESGDSNWVWLPPMRSVSKFKVEALGK